MTVSGVLLTDLLPGEMFLFIAGFGERWAYNARLFAPIEDGELGRLRRVARNPERELEVV